MGLKCLGFGEQEGKCKESTYPGSSYWCENCDNARMAHITRQLTDMVNLFGISSTDCAACGEGWPVSDKCNDPKHCRKAKP